MQEYTHSGWSCNSGIRLQSAKVHTAGGAPFIKAQLVRVWPWGSELSVCRGLCVCADLSNESRRDIHASYNLLVETRLCQCHLNQANKTLSLAHDSQ